MRKNITRVGQIASRSAGRLYDQHAKPFFDEIKHKEAKETFASTLMLRASADLFHVLGPDFNQHLDMLVDVMKEQAKNAQK